MSLLVGKALLRPVLLCCSPTPITSRALAATGCHGVESGGAYKTSSLLVRAGQTLTRWFVHGYEFHAVSIHRTETSIANSAVSTKGEPSGIGACRKGYIIGSVYG